MMYCIMNMYFIGMMLHMHVITYILHALIHGVQGLLHVQGLQGVQGMQHVQGVLGVQHVQGLQHVNSARCPSSGLMT